MSNNLYDNFLRHYKYLDGDVKSYEDIGGGELIIHLKDGKKILYDVIDDNCRALPSDAHSMTEQEFNADLGARLRGVMRRKGFTQRNLSEQTGISQATISNYMAGKRTPSLYNIDKIARALGCSVDDLRYL